MDPDLLVVDCTWVVASSCPISHRLHTLQLLVPSKIPGCGEYHIPDGVLAGCHAAQDMGHVPTCKVLEGSCHVLHYICTHCIATHTAAFENLKPSKAASRPRLSGYRSHPHFQVHVQRHFNTRVPIKSHFYISKPRCLSEVTL